MNSLLCIPNLPFSKPEENIHFSFSSLSAGKLCREINLFSLELLHPKL